MRRFAWLGAKIAALCWSLPALVLVLMFPVGHGGEGQVAIGLTVALLTYPSVLFYPFLVSFFGPDVRGQLLLLVFLGYLQWSTIGAIGGVAVYLLNKRATKKIRPN